MVAPPPILSVILPTYNRKKLVGRAIDSILSQNFLDFELIIVDDGSTDNTIKVLETYKDPRIRIFQKENGGVSSARNLGLRQARGEYVTFVDSDDWLSQGFFDDAIMALKENQAGGLFYGGMLIERWRKRKIPLFWDKRNAASEIYQTDEIFKDFCLLSGVSWGCAKFFNRALLQKYQIEFFEDLSYGEDLIFVLNFLLFSPSIEMREGIFYYCDARHKSLCRGHMNLVQKMDSLLSGHQKIQSLLLDNKREDLLGVFNTLMIAHFSSLYFNFKNYVALNSRRDKEWKLSFETVLSKSYKTHYTSYHRVRDKFLLMDFRAGIFCFYAFNVGSRFVSRFVFRPLRLSKRAYRKMRSLLGK